MKRAAKALRLPTRPSARALKAMTPGQLSWRAIEPFFEAVSIYEGPEVYLEQLKRAPEVSGQLLAAFWCKNEVCHGGFDQFFFNSTGVLAPEALKGLSLIAATQALKATRAAMKLLGAPYPRDQVLRRTRLAEVSRTRFTVLDAVFMRDADLAGFDALADAFVAANLDDCFTRRRSAPS